MPQLMLLSACRTIIKLLHWLAGPVAPWWLCPRHWFAAAWVWVCDGLLLLLVVLVVLVVCRHVLLFMGVARNSGPDRGSGLCRRQAAEQVTSGFERNCTGGALPWHFSKVLWTRHLTFLFRRRALCGRRSSVEWARLI